MPVIVVANPKGGVGKTTLSTNLAGYLASRGRSVMLGDVDRQQSSKTWLGLRPAGLPKIASWEVSRDDTVRPPEGTSHIVPHPPARHHRDWAGLRSEVGRERLGGVEARTTRAAGSALDRRLAAAVSAALTT